MRIKSIDGFISVFIGITLPVDGHKYDGWGEKSAYGQHMWHVGIYHRQWLNLALLQYNGGLWGEMFWRVKKWKMQLKHLYGFFPTKILSDKNQIKSMIFCEK